MKKGKIYNEESFACPHCGNAVFGNLVDTVGRKIARGAGTAAIGWIPGSGLIREKVQDFYEDIYCSIDDNNEFDFECPACGHKWRWTYYQAKQHRYQGGSSSQNLSVGAFFFLILVSFIFVAGIYLFNYYQIYTTDGSLNSAGWAAWILTIIGSIGMLCIAYAYLSGGFVGFLAFLAIISIDSTSYLLLKNNRTTDNDIIASKTVKDVATSTSLVMPQDNIDSFLKDKCNIGSYEIPLSNGITAKIIDNSNEATLFYKSSSIGSISVEYIPDEEYDLKAHCKSLSEAFIDAPLAWSKVKNRNIMFVTIADPSAPNIYHAYLYCGHYKGEQISMKLCSSVGNDAVVRKFFENVVANIRYQERISLLDNEEQNDSQRNIITTGDPNDSIIATYETSNGMVSYVIKKTDSYDPEYFFSYDHSSNSYHSFAENLEKEMAMSFKEAKAIGQYIYLIANNMGSGIGNTDIVLKFDSNTETFEHVFGGGVAKFVEDNKIECTEYEISIPEGGCNADATYNYTTRIIDM